MTGRVGAVLLLVAGLADASGAQAVDAAAELRQVCRQLVESDETYFGRASAIELRQRLGGSFESEQEEVDTAVRYGRELLELGQPLEAIEILQKALSRASALEPNQVAWLLRNLGLAHLQASEDLNCLEHHTAASCILPIRGDGVHRQPEHAQVAMRIFLQLLKGAPEDAEIAWLANLSSMLSGSHPEGIPESVRADAARVGSLTGERAWVDRAHEWSVAATDLAGGAVMDDFDGDGRLDLVTTTSDPCGPMKAFRNLGEGRFEDVSESWRLREQLGGLNLVHADYDDDGDLDLLVLRGAWLGHHGRIRNSLLRNDVDRGGGFVDVTRAAGVAEPAAPTQTAAWADYDGDGDLDLYVGNETAPDVPLPSQLFRNRGDGTFEDVTRAAGVANGRFAKGVAWGDYDDDGDPDLYVSNLGANRLYRNQSDGSFVDVAVELGVTEPDGRSFATWFFDDDNDGDLDLFVVDYSAEVAAVAAYYLGRDPGVGRPRLYRNQGGTFVDLSRELALDLPALVMGANFGDLDNDGFLDLYLGTGDPEFETLFPNLVLRNLAGAGYSNEGDAFRLGHLQKGHGVAFGDVDGDGDQDLLHQLGGFYPGDDYANALFENPVRGQRWVTLRFEGRAANRFAIGARIEVRVTEAGVERSIHRLVGSGGSFGGSSLQQEIGLGRADSIRELRVAWPGSGSEQSWTDVEPNAAYLVIEGAEHLERIDLAAKPASDPRQQFFDTLAALCGATWEGYSSFPEDPEHAFAGKLLVATLASCAEDEIRIPFTVGDDRSRTWILRRDELGLLFKHDHRHKDGTPDEITMYGGWATSDGDARSQSFPADQETRELIPAAATNVWTVSLSADGCRLTYYLERHGRPRFRATLERRDSTACQSLADSAPSGE